MWQRRTRSRDRSGPDLLDMLGPFARAEKEEEAEAPAAPPIPVKKVETDAVADGLRKQRAKERKALRKSTKGASMTQVEGGHT